MDQASSGWWRRPLWWMARGAFSLVQFVMVLLIAVLTANAKSENNNLWGILALGGFFLALSATRLKLHMGLPGLREETQGERLLLAVQVVAFGGVAFAVSSNEQARWGWAPMAFSAVLHLVLKGGYWTIYSPAHQVRQVVKWRVIWAGLLSAVCSTWMFFRWFDEWGLGSRLVATALGAYLVASTLLAMQALTRALGVALGALPEPASTADYQREWAAAGAYQRRTGRTLAPTLTGGTIEKNAVSGLARALFTIVLVPLTFLVGLPLPPLYAYVLLRREPVAAPFEPSAPPEQAVGTPAAPAPPPRPWNEIARAAAAQLLVSGGLGAATLFIAVLLGFYRAHWLAGAGTLLGLLLASALGFLGGLLGVLWGASFVAELASEQVQATAVDASGRLVQSMAERVSWVQRGLTLNELEQVVTGWVNSVIVIGSERGAIARLGARLIGWLARRFAASVRDSVAAVARRNGHADVTVWDVETALREGVVSAAADKLGVYLRLWRNLVQVGYAALLAPCALGIALGGVGSASPESAVSAGSACNPDCSYNAGCSVLYSYRDKRPCCQPIGSFLGDAHAANCRNSASAR